MEHHDTVRFETRQSLAQRASTDPQLRSDLVLPKHLPRAEHAIQDGIPQFLIDDAGKSFSRADPRKFVCVHVLIESLNQLASLSYWLLYKK
jgi:hypothetical protein